jgi:ADP-heptose:LPS heptosyltransferase
MPERSPRILVIRRDNIGDLACTTPLLRALRRQLPDAHLAALVTRYNAPVLAHNADLDAVHSYTKAKHRAAGESVLGIYGRRLKQVMQLRNERFDWVLLPGGPQASSMRTARWVRARRILVRDNADAVAGSHEVEQCCHLLARMGLRYETPPSRVAADPAEAGPIVERMRSTWRDPPRAVIGLHISARKVPQRWPIERFAALARRLHQTTQAGILLLWAPGASDDPLHPGDDEKARALCAALPDVPVLPVRTLRLAELIAALGLCDRLICSDGGAMHLAAALDKPIVCLFGNSSAERWHPWGVRYELLQPASRDVSDISVDDVLAAHGRLQASFAGPGSR